MLCVLFSAVSCSKKVKINSCDQRREFEKCTCNLAYKEFYRSKNPLVHGCWLLYLCFLIYLCIIYFLLLLKFLCRRKYCCFLRLFFSLHCSKRCESFFDCCAVVLLSTQSTLKYIRDWIRVNRLNNGAVRYPSDRDAYF